MFAPTRTWRRWHRKVNVNQKRHAVASALAASAIAPLVMARGHLISDVPEIPLVIANESVETLEKTKKAFAFLKAIGAASDVIKVKESKTLRAGKGKFRNRRYTLKRGPLIIHDTTGVVPLTRAFRNLPGVEFSRVQELNPLLLTPGGHIGRFIIWTRSAFEKLDEIWGTAQLASKKVDYFLPRPIVSNDDISRIIESDQIQNLLRLKRAQSHKPLIKHNPFKSAAALARLNPLAPELKAAAQAKAKKELDAKKAKSAPGYKKVKKAKVSGKEKTAVRKHLYGA